MSAPGAGAMRVLPVEVTADPQRFRAAHRRDFAINVLLGGLWSPVARRHAAQHLAAHTLLDGTPLQVVAVKASRWPALLLVALFLALRVAAEFGRGPPLPLVIAGGVLLVPYLWGTVTARSVASLRWRDWRPRFAASWREVYAASWPLLVLGIAWAFAEPAVSRAAAQAGEGLGPAWTAGLLAAAAVSFPLLVRLGYGWRRLRLERTDLGGPAIRWPATFASHLRVWAGTLAGIALMGVLPVVLLRHALLGSFTLAGAEPDTAALAMAGGLVLVSVLATPVRAWHEARSFALTWDGLQVGDVARVACRLDVGAFVRLRTRHAWRALATLGRSRPDAIVDIHRAKMASLRIEAAV